LEKKKREREEEREYVRFKKGEGRKKESPRVLTHFSLLSQMGKGG